MSPNKKAILCGQVQEMLERGVIVPSTSQYSSPPVLVSRPGKKPRFCIDFRAINKITKDEVAQLPKISDTLKELGQAKFFTTLDLASGYWQIPMDASSRQYTAFSTPDGAHYEFTVMPFGLKCSSATFQNLMCREVLTGYLHKFCKVYLDDILIYSNTLQEHQEHLTKVFERLRIHRLRVSAEKCHVAQECLEFLGHEIGKSKIRPLQKHISAVQQATPPRTRKELQSFLGTLNWIREYVPKAAELTRPLTMLLQKGLKFRWTKEAETAFQEIKAAISQPLELHRPDFSKEFVLQTDASQIGIAAVLWQPGEGDTKQIVSYSSNSLTRCQQNYHVNELEVMSAVIAIRKYSEYLIDKPFRLVTDSRALKWLDSHKDSKSKLMRWALALQEYSFVTVHTPGRENHLPDFLSRHPDPATVEEDVDTHRLVFPEARNEELGSSTEHRVNLLNSGQLFKQVARAQQRSTAIQQDIIRWRTINRRGAHGPVENAFYQNHWVAEDLLWKRGPDGDQLILPSRYVERVIAQAHDTEEAGHPGGDETLREVLRRYYRPGLHKRVRDYVNNCLICASAKSNKKQKEAPLRPRHPQSQFEVVSVDVMGPYDKSPNGNRFIIILEDIFTKWVEAVAVREATGSTICQFLEDNIFTRYGPPKTIISDNGSAFHSNRYLALCDEYQTTPYYSPGYHQRANSVERKVQELKKTLRILLSTPAKQRKWDEYLAKALRILRTRRNRATGLSPAKALLGYELPKKGEWLTNVYNQERINDVKNRREKLRKLKEYQRRFNRDNYIHYPIPPKTFQVGDMVMVRETSSNDGCFPNKWAGPISVEKVLSNEVYGLIKSGRYITVHVDRLRPAPRGNVAPEDIVESDVEDPEDVGDSPEASEDEENLKDHGEEPTTAPEERSTTPPPKESEIILPTDSPAEHHAEDATQEPTEATEIETAGHAAMDTTEATQEATGNFPTRYFRNKSTTTRKGPREISTPWIKRRGRRVRCVICDVDANEETNTEQCQRP